MRPTTPVLAALSVSVVAVLAAGCSVGEGSSDGPRMKICGSYIGEANAVGGVSAWYVDASAKNATLSLSYFAPDPTAAGTWVRLTTNCAAGADVTISDPSVIQVSGQIQTQDGKYAALRFSPAAVGRSTVTIDQSDSKSEVVTITVVLAPGASSS